MKHQILFFLILCCPALFGQTHFYYGLNGTTVNLNPKKSVVRLKMESGTNLLDLNAILGQYNTDFDPLSSSEYDEFLVSMILYLKSQPTDSDYYTLVDDLNDETGVEYCYAFYEGVGDQSTMTFTNEVLIGLNSPADLLTLQSWATTNGLVVGNNFNIDPNIYLLSTTPGTNGECLTLANQAHISGLFDFAEPNMVVYNIMTSNDYSTAQWGLNNTGYNYFSVPGIPLGTGKKGADIRAYDAWKIADGCHDVSIGIFDFGIYDDHEDLNVLFTRNYMGLTVQDGIRCSDPAGISGMLSAENLNHGTKCAGVSSALKNGLGGDGVAPGTSLGNFIVVNGSYGFVGGLSGARPGSTSTSIQLNALGDAAGSYEVDVINMSYAVLFPSRALSLGFSSAFNSGREGLGILLVSSTGNNLQCQQIPTAYDWYPAAYSDVIGTSASENCDKIKWCNDCTNITDWGSYYGDHTDVAAPGEMIPTTTYKPYGGTGTTSQCPDPSDPGDYMTRPKKSLQVIV